MTTSQRGVDAAEPVRQPLDEMSRAMADLLLAQITGGAGRDGHVICPTTLIHRGTA